VLGHCSDARLNAFTRHDYRQDRPLAEQRRPDDIEGMVDQGLHALKEKHGVRQLCVDVEGSFINPARVKIEKPWIARGTISLDYQATGLRAYRAQLIAHQSCYGIFLAVAGVETSKDR